MSDLPPCGLYRTTRELAGVPSGRLVYFHDHGEPGPGIYLPEGWLQNRARFSGRGHTLTPEQAQEGLAPVEAEGFYCVSEAFYCCDKNCRKFEPGELLQLGYDGAALPILFVPQWSEKGFTLPENGTRVDSARLSKLAPMKVPGTEAGVRRGLH